MAASPGQVDPPRRPRGVPLFCGVLYREFDDDRAWLSAAVESIRRGGAAPRSSWWEIAETGNLDVGLAAVVEHARGADRSRSVHLCDAALAISEPERLRRVAAYEEGSQGAWGHSDYRREKLIRTRTGREQERSEKSRLRVEKKEARLQAQREYDEAVARRRRRREEADAAWVAAESAAREEARRRAAESRRSLIERLRQSEETWREQRRREVAAGERKVIDPDERLRFQQEMVELQKRVGMIAAGPGS